MKLRNRILSAVMAIVASMTFVGTSAFAADGYEYSLVPSVDGKIAAGTEFTVDVNLTENAGIISLVAYVDYDAEGLEMTAAPVDNKLIGGCANEAAVKNPYKLFYNDGLATEDHTGTGSLATFSFKAIKDGSYDITITCEAENTNNFDFDECDFGTKTITIEVGADEAKVKVIGDESNKKDKAPGEAYTQGFLLEVPVVKDAIAVNAKFTKDAGANYTEAKPIFTDFAKFSGEASFVLGLNVKNVPYDVTVGGQFDLVK